MDQDYGSWLASLTPEQRAALGNRTQSQAAPMPAPASLLPVQGASSPIRGGLLSADTANAGVGSVPQFNPPVNPATAVHHSFIGGLLGKIGHVAHQAYDNFTTNVAGLSSADLATMTPYDIAVAKRQALSGFLSRASHPQYDAAGFRENGIQANSAGVGAGREQAQNFLGRAQQAAQYAAGLAQQQRLDAARTHVGQLLEPQPGDQLDHDALLNRITQGVFSLTAAGDDKGAQALDGLAKGMREGRVTAQQAYQYLQNGDGIFQINRATGDMKKLASNQSELEHERARRVALAQSDYNAGLHTQSNFSKLADPFTKASAAFANYHAVEAQALAGNPAATKTLVTAFASAADPKVQQRLGTIQYLQNIDPSLMARAQRFLSTSKTGTLPPEQIKAMSAVVKQIEDVSRQRYEAVRAESIRQNARVEGLSAPASVEYNDPTEDGTSEPGPTAPVNPFRNP